MLTPIVIGIAMLLASSEPVSDAIPECEARISKSRSKSKSLLFIELTSKFLYQVLFLVGKYYCLDPYIVDTG